MILHPMTEGPGGCEELCSSQVDLEAMGCVCEEKIVAG